MSNQIRVQEKHLEDTSLLKLTINQLNKDFGDIDLGLNEILLPEISFDRLVLVLARTVGILLEQNLERLFNVLYKIDLPEKNTLTAMESISPATALSELILKRELQKVVIRQMLS